MSLDDVDSAQKKRAQYLMAYAIARGELKRSSACQRCGRVTTYTLDGHHHKGYAEEFALDVQWLCRSCHKLVHNTQVIPPESRERIRQARLGVKASEETRSKISASHKQRFTCPKCQRLTTLRWLRRHVCEVDE